MFQIRSAFLRVAFAAAAIVVFGLTGSRTAEAQVSVHVDLHWSWGSDGVVYYPAPARPAGYVRHVMIPRGHFPPPGLCRAWIPGRPPGHQPPPVPCYALTGPVPVGAIVIGSNGGPWAPYYSASVYSYPTYVEGHGHRDRAHDRKRHHKGRVRAAGGYKEDPRR